MKSIASALLFVFAFQLLSNPAPPNSLGELNKYWCNLEAIPISNHALAKMTEAEIIEFHLNAVIDSLQRVELSTLRSDQKQKRENLLRVLQKYADDQLFPKNTFHRERTPYFIDKYGTACAVGHLIIESGHRDLADKISSEMNYSYLEDMPYPEISKWAEEHGFSIDELKWIQPTYGPNCQPGSAIDACDSSGCGCLLPDLNSWPQNWASYTVEYNDGNGWVVDSNLYWYYWCARVGDHRFTVTDSNNQQTTFIYNIGVIDYQVDTMVTSLGNAPCNGLLKSRSNKDYPSLHFQLHDSLANYVNSDSLYFDNLCPGNYRLRVTDLLYQCSSRWYNIHIPTSVTDLEEPVQDLTKLSLWPNPCKDVLSIELPFSQRVEIKIYNNGGQVVRCFSTAQKLNKVKIADLKEGYYYVQISGSNLSYSSPFVKL